MSARSMSARPEELRGPVSQPKDDPPANESGTIASNSGNSVSAHKVYAMHGLLLSGIELVLTVGNALSLDAFQLNSFSDLIFGGSVVIEAVGFSFAVVMALRALLYPVTQGVVGVGVPALVIVEATVVEGSGEEMVSYCVLGLCAQSLCFLVFAVVSWISSPASVPTVSTAFWIALAGVCAFILSACFYRRSRPGGTMKELVLCVFLSVPFVVEVSESALLFTSGSTAFVAYLLAVLDLVIIGPAALVSILAVVIFTAGLFD